MTNHRCLLAVALFAFAAAAPSSSASAAPKNAKRILLFTRSAEFEHSTIKTGKDEQPFALGVLSALGLPKNWEFVHTKDGGFITAENLAKFDAFIFITTGDLTTLRKDKEGKPLPPQDVNQQPMTAQGKADLLAAVAGGKGFLALHNGSDTFHSPGDRWVDQPAEQVDPYIAMLGGEFIMHGEQQMARLRVVDKKFPGFGDIGDTLELKEEWYSLKNQAADMHALLVLESEAMTGPMYARPAFPLAWVRKHGKGRVFYSALGHREDVWTHPAFQRCLSAVWDTYFVLVTGPTTATSARPHRTSKRCQSSHKPQRFRRVACHSSTALKALLRLFYPSRPDICRSALIHWEPL